MWVPTPPAFAAALLPGWGSVQPWVLESGAQFRPDEGPDLTSHRYARDLNEVKEIGALNSATRTAEQTNIARFWLASAASFGTPCSVRSCSDSASTSRRRLVILRS